MCWQNGPHARTDQMCVHIPGLVVHVAQTAQCFPHAHLWTVPSQNVRARAIASHILVRLVHKRQFTLVFASASALARAWTAQRVHHLHTVVIFSSALDILVANCEQPVHNTTRQRYDMISALQSDSLPFVDICTIVCLLHLTSWRLRVCRAEVRACGGANADKTDGLRRRALWLAQIAQYKLHSCGTPRPLMLSLSRRFPPHYAES